VLLTELQSSSLSPLGGITEGSIHGHVLHRFYLQMLMLAMHSSAKKTLEFLNFPIAEASRVGGGREEPG